jgi:hypothetical protein
MMKINYNLKSNDYSISVLVKWILSVCLNMYYLQIEILDQSDCLHNELARLTKLKELDLKATDASKLKEVTLIAFRITTTLLTSSQIVRSCRQVEILRMKITCLGEPDLARLEPAGNFPKGFRQEKGVCRKTVARCQFAYYSH